MTDRNHLNDAANDGIHRISER